MSRKNKKIKKRFRIFSTIIWIILSVATLYFSFNIFKTDMIPDKYLIIGGIAILSLIVLTGFLTISRKSGVKTFIIVDIIMILFISMYLFAGNKINVVYNFLENNLGIKYKTNIYNVAVKVDSEFNSLSDIEGKTIIYFDDSKEESQLVNEIKEKIKNANITKGNDMNTALVKITQDPNYIVIVNSGNYDAMTGIDEEYYNKTKIIATIEIKKEIEEEKNQNIEQKQDITNNPFVVYISGIDTRSGKLPNRSLTDVNIIMAVNPKTKKVLMVHIPRDMYVKVPGKQGARDKLTHLGTIGGVEMTMEAIEDLVDINFSYYIRLNFNSVIKLVDAIGGIDVYSDVNYKFNAYNLPSLTIYPLQMNHLNGNEALAFAKERHAYVTGDRHRGENQEQVIQRIIEKMSSSTKLLTKSNEILKALEGTFETNISANEISELVKMQLDDMAKWKVEIYNINGTSALDYTYSYPNQQLYIMHADTATITEAKKKLDEFSN